ncbi:MAG TPA: sterol carrier family protein [Jatrophihabitans sp.]|jgi:uncharacterized protein (TIGR03083 family)
MRLAREIEAYNAQAVAVADWLGSSYEPDAPTVLSGWTLHTLVGHLVGNKDGLQTYLAIASPGPAMPVAAYVQAYAPAAADITAASYAVAADLGPADLLDRLRTPVAVPSLADTAVVAGPRGAISALDFARTRVVDLVVHCDDLSRSFPSRPPVPLLRPALATTVRTLAEILAAQAPGRSVEVRVPPFVAVQAVAGPRHTRGTPPNIVETDPATWLRVATGRTPFADAVANGAIRASGNRSDLTDYLPVLA